MSTRLQLMDEPTLDRARDAARTTPGELAPALERLTADARSAADREPVSVADLERLPPSGDPRDYRSWGSYWWPDPEAPDGRPWIRRDGELHPDARGNRIQVVEMTEAVETLALAAHLFDEDDFAEATGRWLDAFFLDPETGMRPHLTYAQAIPGRCEGRGIGLIDTHPLVRIPDAVALFDHVGQPVDELAPRLRHWFANYLDWLLTSDHGRDEATKTNNHGTYYDKQVASFAIFTGQADIAGEAIRRAADQRLPAQLDDAGGQPHELARTRSYSYACMNLQGFLEIACLGRRIGIDLAGADTGAGRHLRRALDWFEPYVDDPASTWDHEQITGLDPTVLAGLMHRAAGVLAERKYLDWSERAGGVPADDRVRLTCAAPEDGKG